jgi:hypothetical protein
MPEMGSITARCPHFSGLIDGQIVDEYWVRRMEICEYLFDGLSIVTLRAEEQIELAFSQQTLIRGSQ